MKACAPPPLWNLASLFPLWRELLAPINEFVIGESPYAKEALDLLLNLFGAKVLGWKELCPLADGSVLLTDIERELMEIVPREDWFQLTYLLIEHGRAVCTAKRARCGECLLADVCPSAFKV